MKREELADFLKRRRDALTPHDVGLEEGRRRRTAGLRREEVASLAHMSTDFYARLEQQRGSRPSEQTVAALSQALRLTRDESDHLFALAGHNPPLRIQRADRPSPALQRVLERLDAPAQIVSDLYVTLEQNALSVALIGDQTCFEGPRRSLIFRWFMEPAGRSLFPPEDHEEHSRNHVAALRALHGRSGDPEAAELVECLLRDSPEFSRLWERHEVRRRAFTLKRFLHPLAGLLTLDCQVLTGESLTERLVVFTPVNPADLARLRQIAQPQAVMRSMASGGASPW